MGYSVYLNTDHRWAGYGVPAVCDHPDCNADIDRGMGYACGGGSAEYVQNCGLFFCESHLCYSARRWDDEDEDEEEEEEEDEEDEEGAFVCARCAKGEPSFDPKPDTAEWIEHMLTDESWQPWRDDNPQQVSALTESAG